MIPAENKQDMFYFMYHNGEEHPVVYIYNTAGEAIGKFLLEIMADFAERERSLTEDEIRHSQLDTDVSTIVHQDQCYRYCNGKTVAAWGRVGEDVRLAEFAKRAWPRKEDE